MALSTTDGFLANLHAIFHCHAFRNPKPISISNSSFMPHLLRHGIASIDPRFEQNRSFHQLSGHLKSTRIEHEAVGRQTKGMATATFKWGQDQLAEKREDSAGDEALADVTDRLAYMLSFIGDLHNEHAQRIEDSRADLKRIQKLEMELAPRRQQRIKIHKELMTLIPERAIPNSEKIAPLEEQLKTLELEDKEKEEELGKLKREAVRSSYDAHFDSIIELGEKMAVISRYGKLLLEQLPVYAPPFPTPRHHSRLPEEAVWKNETQVAAIRAAVGPAVKDHKPDYTLPSVPITKDASTLSRRDTVSFAESNKTELAEMLHEDEITTSSDNHPAGSSSLQQSTDDTISQSVYSRQSFGGTAPLSPLPEGGSLPPNLNLEPTVLPDRRPSQSGLRPDVAGHSPSVPPRSVHDEQYSTATDAPPEYGSSAHNATIADGGPTFAETGSPISTTDPGPISGVLSPRPKGAERKPMPALPSDNKNVE